MFKFLWALALIPTLCFAQQVQVLQYHEDGESYDIHIDYDRQWPSKELHISLWIENEDQEMVCELTSLVLRSIENNGISFEQIDLEPLCSLKLYLERRSLISRKKVKTRNDYRIESYATEYLQLKALPDLNQRIPRKLSISGNYEILWEKEIKRKYQHSYFENSN